MTATNKVILSAQPVKQVSDTVLSVKFSEAADVDISGEQFVSRTGQDMASVNQILTGKVSRKNRLFGGDAATLKARRTQLRKSHGTAYVPDLNGYYRIVLRSGRDMQPVLTSLKQSAAVVDAYAEPLPAPSPASPNFSAMQTYMAAAPTGMGIATGNNFPGEQGDAIRIVDIEYSWNTDHEDISRARAIDAFVTGTTPYDPFHDTNHGTAVMSLISGDRNGYGVDGVIPQAELHMVNAVSETYGWDIANAIYTAQGVVRPGDVILIEQQMWGPDGHGYLPAEWNPAVYDAIRLATLNGIIVIEAVGNGNENLDNPVFGTTFPGGKADSGAIIVGAGTACNGTTRHARVPYSNYGSRVNVQGFGECVAAAGYGELFDGGSKNSQYTATFGGTSSASALVAAIAGSVSSSYQTTTSKVLTPEQMRLLLVETGVAQDSTDDSGHIGPLVNLDAALRTFNKINDTTPPTAPLKLGATQASSAAVTLSWKSSVDDQPGILLYYLYRNGIFIGLTADNSFVDKTVHRRANYTYQVKAVDAAGNTSDFSNAVAVRVR